MGFSHDEAQLIHVLNKIGKSVYQCTPQAYYIYIHIGSMGCTLLGHASMKSGPE